MTRPVWPSLSNGLGIFNRWGSGETRQGDNWKGFGRTVQTAMPWDLGYLCGQCCQVLCIHHSCHRFSITVHALCYQPIRFHLLLMYCGTIFHLLPIYCGKSFQFLFMYGGHSFPLLFMYCETGGIVVPGSNYCSCPVAPGSSYRS